MNLCQYIPNVPLNIHSRESKIMTQVDLRREWRTYNRKFYPSLEKFTQTCLRRLRHLETLWLFLRSHNEYPVKKYKKTYSLVKNSAHLDFLIKSYG